jgi:hypothetical protein
VPVWEVHALTDDGPRAVVVRWVWAQAAMKSPPPQLTPILEAYVQAKAALAGALVRVVTSGEVEDRLRQLEAAWADARDAVSKAAVNGA